MKKTLAIILMVLCCFMVFAQGASEKKQETVEVVSSAATQSTVTTEGDDSSYVMADGADIRNYTTAKTHPDFNVTVDSEGNTTLIDMLGRTVTFKGGQDAKIWNSSPTSEGLLCAIAPEQILGWARPFSEEQLAYYPEVVRNLPVLGGNYGGKTANVEGILTYSPDVIVNEYANKTEEDRTSSIESADSNGEKYNAPVIALSRNIWDTGTNARLLGEALGKAERGAEVEAYIDRLLKLVDDTVAAADHHPTYYYAEELDGLSTESPKSFHVDVFNYCQLQSAAGSDVVMSSMYGMEAVSLEQVMQWDPEYIFVYEKAAYDTITTDESWSEIRAVKEGKVYLNPSIPQNWFDRSPCSLRVLGCLFAASICYPDTCTYNLREEVYNFFDFMYGIKLTDAQLDAVMPDTVVQNEILV